MTLIRCQECGQQISDKAESCPQCGYCSLQDNHRSDQPELENFHRPVVDEVEAERRIIEEQIKNDWVAQTIAKGTESSMKRFWLRSIAYVCGLLFIVITGFTYWTIVKQKEIKKRVDVEAANELKSKRKWFSAAKAILASPSNIPMKDLYRIEDSLKSVTLDMEEYQEAQNLLNKTNHMLEIARKDMLEDLERDRKKAKKEHKAEKIRVKQEETSSRKKGKYSHRKAVQRAHSPSSLGLKTFAAAQDPTAAFSCYEIGVRYGRCGELKLERRVCDPNDDITVPLRCRGKAETKRGIAAGVRAVH